MNGTLAQPCMSGQLYLTQFAKLCRRQLVQKVLFLTPVIWTPLKDIATKSGESHVRVRALQSCKFSRPSARNICLWAKIHIFPHRRIPWGLPWTVPYYTSLESSGWADFKLLTCTAATYRFRDIRFIDGQNYGFWGFLGDTAGPGAPKGKDLLETHIYHHAKFHADRWHRRRDMWSRTKRHALRKRLYNKKAYWLLAFAFVV